MTEQLIEKVSKKSTLSFASLNFAHQVLSGLGTGPITYYYNTKLGLSPFLVGLAWILFIAWNSVNDPLFGFIEDRTKTKKYGRRIPYLRFGAPVYAIVFILIWFPIVDINNEIALFVNYLLVLFAFDTMLTIIGLITYSMPAEMAVSSKVRSGIMISVSIFSGFGLLISFLIPTLLLTGESAPPLEIFQYTMIIIGIICGIIIFLGSFFIKENKYTQLEEPLSFWKSLIETFKNKPFLIFEASVFSFVVAQNMLMTGVFYYIDYVLQVGGVLSMLPIAIFFLVIFGFTVFYNKLIRKYELKDVYVWMLYLTCLSFYFFFLLGWNFFSAIIGLILLGISFSGYYMTGQLVIADTIDYDEILTGKRRETSYSGVNALITKPAVSIGPWLFLTIISAFDFNSKATTQTLFAQFGIMLAFTIIPAVLILISALIMHYFPLSGQEWKEKKIEIEKVHLLKEKKYLDYLREQQGE